MNDDYVPKHLTKKDKIKQKREIKKSRKWYKKRKRKYYLRDTIKSFKSKKSPHVSNAKKMYKINTMNPSATLARKTKCSKRALNDIVKKGKGAYYSSGSRPNQTPHSWGLARLASALTGGPSSCIDLHILKEGCKKTSKALKLAEKNKGKGRRKTAKISI